jgi:catechol-2,3-dioxygenase
MTLMNEEERPMADDPVALRFSHIGFRVHDLDRMAGFYKGLLGFTETDRGTLPGTEGEPLDLVFLSRDPDEHHQIVLVSGRPSRLAFNPINQISLHAGTLPSLLAFHRQVQAWGVNDLQAVTHGNALSLYFRDPEGNRIEVYVDTPWYVSQPARVPAPFDLPADALLQWAEAHARTLPGFRPRAEWRADMAERMAGRTGGQAPG